MKTSSPAARRGPLRARRYGLGADRGRAGAGRCHELAAGARQIRHRLGLAGRAAPSRPIKRVVRPRPTIVQAAPIPEIVEVETPILQNQAGGANAKTFDTHHNDYDMDMVMRIAVELDHKIIMAGGIPRIYEIGKMFRNEGSDPSHIQEFTMIERYSAYNTLAENIEWTEKLLKHLAMDIVNKTEFKVWDKENNEHQISFDGAWPKRRFDELLMEYANNETDEEKKENINEIIDIEEEKNWNELLENIEVLYGMIGERKKIRELLINGQFNDEEFGERKRE